MSDPVTAKTQPETAGEAGSFEFFHQDIFVVPADGSKPYLKGYRCRKCGRLEFPKPPQCPACWSEEFVQERLSEKGTLYSYTDVFVGQQDMELPYIICYIDLPQGIRICAQLDGEVGSFGCGEEVEVCEGVIRTNPEGLPVRSYKFRKCEK